MTVIDVANANWMDTLTDKDVATLGGIAMGLAIVLALCVVFASD